MVGGPDTQRRRNKRKLAESFEAESVATKSGPELHDAAGEGDMIANHIKTLRAPSVIVEDRAKLKASLSAIAIHVKAEENVDEVVKEGGVDAIVPLLTAFDDAPDTTGRDEIEKEACIILGLLATKPEFQLLMSEHGALPGLVGLLKRHLPVAGVQPSAATARRAADAITNLAHENVAIKNRVRSEGGVPPLVALLESSDPKVQRAAAGALRTLAFKNEENKNQIVDCTALPTLIQMLRSDDIGIHYEAVGVIGNLVHSSQHIKRRVLEEGALQPVISLLSSKCPESQREAALLLGQFATCRPVETTEPDYKARIVQRGAVPPLITMLHSGDAQLKEMAAFALGRLAQNGDNQAGIVQCGGLKPLLSLLDSNNGNLQHNAAFALYGLADNEDNIADLIKEGGVKTLIECDTIVQQSKDCVQKTLKRLEDKVKAREPPRSRVLARILHMMNHTSDKTTQQRIASALARLVHESDLGLVFVESKGLDVLLDMLVERRKAEAGVAVEAASALFELCKKAKETAAVECPPAPPTPPVYLGEQYVNNPTLSDVTFLVEDRKFHAHRIALLASSDTFRAMFDGNYREKEADTIPIPNIRYNVFEAMMRCIYTGTTEVGADMAQELLAAADQYMLEGMKRLAETAIGNELNAENLGSVYEMAEDYNAPVLARRCILFALEHFEACQAAVKVKEFGSLLASMVPKLRATLTEQLLQVHHDEEAEAPDAPATGQAALRVGVGQGAAARA